MGVDLQHKIYKKESLKTILIGEGLTKNHSWKNR